MRTIGIISDTHGLLRPEALSALEGCALILHAGDVGASEILDTLARIAPVHAVRGNTDHGQLRDDLPATLVVDLDSEEGEVLDAGGTAYVLHDLNDLDLDPATAGIAMVVTGHTHKPLVEEREGVVYLNPGSAGPKRFDLPITVARVVLRSGKIEAEIVEVVKE